MCVPVDQSYSDAHIRASINFHMNAGEHAISKYINRHGPESDRSNMDSNAIPFCN